MNTEIVIVTIIIVVAAIAVARSLYKTLAGKNDKCGCNCDCSQKSCDEN